MTEAAKRILLLIAVLAAVGMVDSSLALRNHYAKSETSFCELGQSFNCDIVNRSSYSVMMGIPVALIGILGYGGLLFLSTLWRNRAETPTLLAVAAYAGLGFALYLTYIEGYILGTWCILCLASLALIVAIAALSSALLVKAMRNL
jgi:vitamin-K-epoxide reductase (warfarin-sensitive)